MTSSSLKFSKATQFFRGLVVVCLIGLLLMSVESCNRDRSEVVEDADSAKLLRNGLFEVIDEFSKSLSLRGIELSIVVFAYRAEVLEKTEAGKSYRRAGDRAVEELRRRGVSVVDVQESMVKSAEQGVAVYQEAPHDFHPLPDGYRLMYEAVSGDFWNSDIGKLGVVGDSFADGFHSWLTNAEAIECDLFYLNGASDQIPRRLNTRSGDKFLENKRRLVWVLGNRYFSQTFTDDEFPQVVDDHRMDGGESGVVQGRYEILDVSEIPPVEDLTYPFASVAVKCLELESKHVVVLLLEVIRHRRLNTSLKKRLVPGARILIDGETVGSGGGLDVDRQSQVVFSDFADFDDLSIWVGNYAWVSNTLDALIQSK